MATAVDSITENAQNPLGELGVLRWVRALTYRVPKAAVVLVGTKCDLVTDVPPLSPLNRLEAAAATVETKISSCISSWAKQNSPQIRLEKGMRLVRFDESTGSPQKDNGESWPCDVNKPGLLGRILHDSSGNKRAVSMRLPLTWHHALHFLDTCARRRRQVKSRQSTHVHCPKIFDVIHLFNFLYASMAMVEEAGVGDTNFICLERPRSDVPYASPRSVLRTARFTLANRQQRTRGISRFPKDGAAAGMARGVEDAKCKWD